MALFNRRGFIASALTATTAGFLGTQPASAAQSTLEAAASRRARYFGSAVRVDQLDTRQPFRSAVLRECEVLVPEFEMNWNALEPSFQSFSFAQMDALASFARRNHKQLRGHTLLWHQGVPDWAVSALRSRRDWTLVAEYFSSVIPRYGSTVTVWEVVNEPIEVGTRSDGLRENVFLQAFGPDYIDRALRQARILAPAAQLMINEYGLEYDLPEERKRRYFLLKLLEALRNQESPLDALGVQAHLDLRKGSIAPRAVSRFLEEVASLGFAIVITELDVKEADYVATMEERDRLVGDEVLRYLDVALQQPAVAGVTTWGLSDLYSWLAVTPDDYARFPGAWENGNGPGFNRGLPLDSSMQPKPMYFSIRDALSSAVPAVQKRP